MKVICPRFCSSNQLKPNSENSSYIGVKAISNLLDSRNCYVIVLAIVSSMLSGCIPTLRDPDRLYTAQEETDIARQRLPELQLEYDNSLSNPSNQKLIRNEIIATRMYTIDANYSQYESSLGRQSQEVGFIADSASQASNIAGALLVVAPTTRILSGVAGGFTGIKGSYQSDVLGSKTVEIIQSQMRANRDEVATEIIQKMSEPTSTYPLPLAYSDLETYYRAGTITSGLIKAADIVGTNAQEAQATRQETTIKGIASDDTAQVLENCWRSSDAKRKTLITLSKQLFNTPLFVIQNDPGAAAKRSKLIAQVCR
jgi:hypothetical protein